MQRHMKKADELISQFSTKKYGPNYQHEIIGQMGVLVSLAEECKRVGIENLFKFIEMVDKNHAALCQRDKMTTDQLKDLSVCLYAVSTSSYQRLPVAEQEKKALEMKNIINQYITGMSFLEDFYDMATKLKEMTTISNKLSASN